MLYLIISWKGSSTVFANTFPPNGIHICMCVPVIENFYIVVYISSETIVSLNEISHGH